MNQDLLIDWSLYFHLLSWKSHVTHFPPVDLLLINWFKWVTFEFPDLVIKSALIMAGCYQPHAKASWCCDRLWCVFMRLQVGAGWYWYSTYLHAELHSAWRHPQPGSAQCSGHAWEMSSGKDIHWLMRAGKAKRKLMLPERGKMYQRKGEW